MNELGSNLRLARKRSNLTLDMVVSILNLGSKQVLSNYETSKREPKLDVLCDLADLYDVSLDELVGRKQLTAEERINSTGLSNGFLGFCEGVSWFPQFVNAVFESEEMRSIIHEGQLLQNMAERIEFTEKHSDPDDRRLYLPDNSESVRIPAEDFFDYHAHKLGDAIAAAVSKWLIARLNCGQKESWDDPEDHPRKK